LKRLAQNSSQLLLDCTAAGIIPVIVVNMKEATPADGNRKPFPAQPIC
jgi:hypothetical protein